MNKILNRAVVALIVSLSISPALAWRGGFGGGGFVARGPEGGFAAGGWHGGGAAGWGGTWHADGYHAGNVWGAGYHGPVVVNSYYGRGCYACGAAAVGAVAGAAAGAAVASYAIGASLATLPAGCVGRSVAGESYFVCNGAWLAPRYGNNGLYYVVVNPL